MKTKDNKLQCLASTDADIDLKNAVVIWIYQGQAQELTPYQIYCIQNNLEPKLGSSLEAYKKHKREKGNG